MYSMRLASSRGLLPVHGPRSARAVPGVRGGGPQDFRAQDEASGDVDAV